MSTILRILRIHSKLLDQIDKKENLQHGLKRPPTKSPNKKESEAPKVPKRNCRLLSDCVSFFVGIVGRYAIVVTEVSFELVV